MEQQRDTRQISATDTLEWMTECLEVRPETGELIWTRPPKYHPCLVGRRAGATQPHHSGKPYHLVQHNGRKFRRSWLIFLWTHGRWPTDCLDHIDGNSLNDAISNLREATIEQNAWNHKWRARRTWLDLPMGVKALHSGKFQARIAHRKTQIALGAFSTFEEAATVYRAARKELFGEFS